MGRTHTHIHTLQRSYQWITSSVTQSRKVMPEVVLHIYAGF